MDSLKLANLLPATSEYDPSLTDLNALLEGTQAEEQQPKVEMENLTNNSASASTVGTNIEWTYLEPAQPSAYHIEEITLPQRQSNNG